MNKQVSPPVIVGAIIVLLVIIVGVYFALFKDHVRSEKDTADAYRAGVQRHMQMMKQAGNQQRP
ncbi:MAG TPA: hypothetical protein VFA07_15750 [Chthonomonadaceae bacterium]|nr:hypothetical protein [Chthonomonadaceae bacterium]